jgi:hypothetical protein
MDNANPSKPDTRKIWDAFFENISFKISILNMSDDVFRKKYFCDDHERKEEIK